jgi:hypothetical protein
MPGNAVWVGFNMIYPKLYSNSLLVSLNSRAALSDETVGVVITDTNDARSLRLTCNINTQDDGTVRARSCLEDQAYDRATDVSYNGGFHPAGMSCRGKQQCKPDL